MTQEQLFFAAIVAIALQVIILYQVIQSATRVKKRILYEWAQTQLLIHIAKAHGMPQEKIDAIREALNK